MVVAAAAVAGVESPTAAMLAAPIIATAQPSRVLRVIREPFRLPPGSSEAMSPLWRGKTLHRLDPTDPAGVRPPFGPACDATRSGGHPACLDRPVGGARVSG